MSSPLLMIGPTDEEVNDSNWGQFTLTLEGDRYLLTQHNPVQTSTEAGTSKFNGDHLILTAPGEEYGRNLVWTLDGDTLTMRRSDTLGSLALIPTIFVIAPWTRAADEPVTPPVSTPTQQALCPGRRCLGELTPGTHPTMFFDPAFTYTVPAGWWNIEDQAGAFDLLPPGATQEGVDPATSDFLGVYASVTAPDLCEERPDPAVATNVQAYVEWLQHQAALVVSEPRPISIGGLNGTEVDVSLSDAPACSDPNIDDHYALVLIGTGPTDLTHAVLTDYPLRLDLFDRPDGTMMAIELADAPNGGSQYEDWWTAAAEITNTFQFQT